MEQQLRYALIQAVPELNDSIYPTNAPEGATKPYLVYARIRTDKTKTLEGYTSNEILSYMFSVMAPRYGAMRTLADKIIATLELMPKTSIGQTNPVYIQDLDITNYSETYEPELKAERGIIDFTIYI